MAEVTIQVYKSELIKSVGKMYRSILTSLSKEKLINSFKDVVEIKMDKSKSIHLQTMLAFYSVKDVAIGPIRHNKKDE